MIEIRATQPDEFRANSAVVSAALLHAPLSEEEWEKSRPSWDDSEAIGAWDGDRCVGTMAAYRFDTLVPGGAWLRTAGVTRVAVLPTHRRAGLARARGTARHCGPTCSGKRWVGRHVRKERRFHRGQGSSEAVQLGQAESLAGAARRAR